MNAFERFIHTLQYVAPKQTAYNWFHLMFIGIALVLSVLVSVLFRNAKDRTYRSVLFTVWIIIFLFELYKQLVLSMEVVNGESKWEYCWNSFPFQFCSSPLYILPFAVFVGNKKAREFFEGFLGFYALFGGLIVMFVPGDVFNTDYLGIAIQTMVHHSLMVVSGVLIIVHNRDNLRLKLYLKGTAIFVVMLAIAFTLNETLIFVTTRTINMFFISRHVVWEPPILVGLYHKLPYVGFLAVYSFGFMAIAFIIFSVSKLAAFAVRKFSRA